MNLLLFDTSERRDDKTICVSDRRLQHLLEVHKAKVGSTLKVGEIDGLTGLGILREISHAQAVIEVELTEHPPPKLPITLVLALPRPKMLRRILRTVAEFGVAELHLINSFRVEKSYWQTPVLQPTQIRELLLLGLEQARDTRLIQVYQHKRFKPWVEDELPTLVRNKRALLCHLDEQANAPTASGEETLVFIGPEGGFIDYELEKLCDAGCETVSLGNRALRVENAVSCALGKLS